MKREAAARHDAVDVRMKRQGLPPGVEHAHASRLDPRSSLCNVDECPSGGTEQQAIEDTRRMQRDDVEDLGHGEDHVKVGNRKKFVASILEPSLASRCPASRTGTVAAGVPLNMFVTTAITRCRCPPSAGVRHAAIAPRALRCAAVVRRPRRKVSLRARTIAPRSVSAAMPQLAVLPVAAFRTRSTGAVTFPNIAGETCV